MQLLTPSFGLIIWMLIPFIPTLWATVVLISDRTQLVYDKLLWLMLILFFPVVGPLIYLFYNRRKRLAS